MPEVAFVHQLPHASLVDRVEYLRELARGRRVIHLGFVDEGRMDAKRGQHVWLHDTLWQTARELVGIDFSADGVAKARSLGFEAYAANCESARALNTLELAPAEVVVAGELIEHLDKPGAFLDAVKRLVEPGGTLVLSTPNASGLTNVVAALAKVELVNPDHVSWYSWRVLTTLLERHGWALRTLAYYPTPRLPVARKMAPSVKAKRRLANGARIAMMPILTLRPALAEGLIAVAELRS